MRRLIAFLLPLSLAVTGCGGNASPTPLPTPTPVPTPTPAPQPTPTPSPTPTPCTQGLCEEPTTNTAPVSRVILRLFQVFDEQNRWILPTPDPVQQVVHQPIPVGWTIKLDVTGKDASNKDTLGQKKILFHYSDADMVEENYLSEWQVRLKILKPGTFRVHAVFDEVGSNDLRFTFVEK